MLWAAHIATAIASVMSSSFGMMGNLRIAPVMAWTCFLSAFPYPVTAIFISSGVYSYTLRPELFLLRGVGGIYYCVGSYQPKGPLVPLNDRIADDACSGVYPKYFHVSTRSAVLSLVVGAREGYAYCNWTFVYTF